MSSDPRLRGPLAPLFRVGLYLIHGTVAVTLGAAAARHFGVSAVPSLPRWVAPGVVMLGALCIITDGAIYVDKYLRERRADGVSHPTADKAAVPSDGQGVGPTA